MSIENKALLEDLLVLQNKAFLLLTEEFYRNVEYHSKLTNRDPLTGMEANGSHESLSIREHIQTKNVIISDTIDKILDELWDNETESIKSSTHMSLLMKKLREEIHTLEDKTQALCLLKLTLQGRKKNATNNAASLFEQEQGYELLADWLAEKCINNEHRNVNFCEFILHLLLSNPPERPFARKILLSKLKKLQMQMKDKKNKEYLRELISQLSANSS
jgi:hypothetical protein